MIPVHLSIEGLYSYQSRQELDFTRLIEAQLFGVFGKVGSGKSSILDAITLALYGETERMNTREKNRGFNLMNLRSNQLYVDFICKDHPEGQQYRFIVQSKRKTKTFEETASLSRKCYKKNGKEWEVTEIKSYEELSGISYDNFKRTVIIPQGKFAEFIHLGETERIQMLRELFDLNRFDLQGHVNRLHQETELKLASMRGKLESLEEVSSENLALILQQVKQDEKNYQAQLKKLKQVKNKREEWDRSRTLQKQWEEAKKNLEQLRQDEGAIRLLEKEIEAYEEARIHFIPELRTLKNHQKQWLEAKSHMEQNKQELGALQKEVLHLEEQVQLAKQGYEQRDHIREEVEDLSKLLALMDLNPQMTALKKEMDSHKVNIKQVEQALSDKQIQAQELQVQKKSKGKAIPGLSEIALMESWFLESQNQEQQKARIKDRSIQVQFAIEQEVQKALQLAGVEKEVKPIWEQLLHKVEEKGKMLRKSFDKASAHIEPLQVRKAMVAHAHDLKDGEPCPLCGSMEHPQPIQSFSEEQLREAKKKLEFAEKKLQESREIYRELLSLQKNVEQFESELASIHKELEEVNQTKRTHDAAFRWEQWLTNDPVSFKEKKSLWQRDHQEMEALDRLAQEVQQEQDAMRKKLDDLKNAIAGDQEDWIRKEAESKRLRKEIRHYNTDQKLSQGKTSLQQEWEHKQNLNKKAEERYRTLQARHLEQVSQRSSLEATLAEQGKHQSRLDKEIKNLEEELNKKLERSQYWKSIEKVQNLMQSLEKDEGLWAQKKGQVDRYQKELHSTQKTIEELNLALTNREKVSEEAWEGLNKELDQLEESNKSLFSNIEKGKSDASQLEKNLQDKELLLQKAESLGQRLDNLSQFRKLFRKNAFVAYAARFYLEMLCQQANQRFFPLTRQQYQLELEDNQFMVRDFLNGGHLRSIKTLSGGQTFQASLCLALALSENIFLLNPKSGKKAAQHFFFMDEGFGALDEESLEQVLFTLQRLRKENRIVGIISHVRELQENLDVYLRVLNDGQKGSQFQFSWDA